MRCSNARCASKQGEQRVHAGVGAAELMEAWFHPALWVGRAGPGRPRAAYGGPHPPLRKRKRRNGLRCGTEEIYRKALVEVRTCGSRALSDTPRASAVLCAPKTRAATHTACRARSIPAWLPGAGALRGIRTARVPPRLLIENGLPAARSLRLRPCFPRLR
jgi:hypothetical protein